MLSAPREQVRSLRNTAKVRCEMVVRGYWRDLFALPNGELGELTLVWGTRNAWQRRPEARGAGWQTLPIGPFVLAYRIQF
mgnify:CR=1 FL=1